MQTPTPHHTPDEHYIQQAQSSQPLYEFVTEASATAETSAGNPLLASDLSPSTEEAIRQGFIYPPPPAFYQKLPPPALLPALPLPPVSPSTSGPEPVQVALASVKRSSRTWIWVVGSVLALTLIVSVSLCGWSLVP